MQMQINNNQQQLSYIPSDAYLYFPKNNSTSRKNNTQREFFDGNTQFDAQENQAIDDFRSYALKQNYTLKQMWTDNMILRFLYANNFKMSKTLSSVKEHTIWRETKLPVIVDEPLQKILNSGLLYVHGRDHKFRPIVIFNVYLLDPKKVDVELITRALTFWFEYVINEWMLPGQVENWVFIADVKGMGPATLALLSIRKLFGYLQDNYKCRLHTLYILNVTSALYAPWQITKKFLDEVTLQKVKICKGIIPVGLLDSVNSEQVEQKYGGAASNSTQYWPPIIPSNNYFVKADDAKALISEKEYVTLYNTGYLTSMHIDKSRVEQRQREHNPIPEVQILSSLSSPSPSSSPSDRSEIRLTPSSETTENLDDEILNEADYLDCMSERSEYHENNKVIVREFHSSFISGILLN